MSEINWTHISTEEIQSLSDLKNFAKKLQHLLEKKAVVTLSGPMAAGKTELVKAYASFFGIDDVSSPTFALHQNYQNGEYQIDHLDLYRIESEDELESAGFWDLFTDSENKTIFIEWPEKMRLWQIPSTWPLYKIEFNVKNNLRSLSVSKR